MNLHSHKYSGLANAKTIQIDHNKGGGLKIVTRKPSANPYQNSTGKHYSSIRQGSGPRRSAGIAAGQSKRNYRPDLRKVSIIYVPSSSKCLHFPIHYTSLYDIRNDVRTLRTPLEGDMNDGRGHDCKSDPWVQFNDQIDWTYAPCRYRTCARS
jgi:hypothetical protein